MSDFDDNKTEAPEAPEAVEIPADEQADGDDGVHATDGTPPADDQRDKYLRLAAEYDNYRRRTAKERQDAQSRGQAELIRDLIDPLDDIGRFAHVDPATTDAKTMVDAVIMVEKKLLKSLSARGLELVNPDGEAFDPSRHEAVMTEPAASAEEDHLVARVFQVGYLFNGQLLRPARVVVKQWNG